MPAALRRRRGVLDRKARAVPAPELGASHRSWSQPAGRLGAAVAVTGEQHVYRLAGELARWPAQDHRRRRVAKADPAFGIDGEDPLASRLEHRLALAREAFDLPLRCADDRHGEQQRRAEHDDRRALDQLQLVLLAGAQLA